VRLGLGELAVQAMQQAVRRDPRNWETHYGLALVLGAEGRDPRTEARRALALNPQNELARTAARAFGATGDPAEWKRRAHRARLPKQ
jgi:Flp pilus assembly protein TadD